MMPSSLALQIKITPLTTKKLEHMGIKVQLLGQIDVSSERGVTHEFMGMGECLSLLLDLPLGGCLLGTSLWAWS